MGCGANIPKLPLDQRVGTLFKTGELGSGDDPENYNNQSKKNKKNQKKNKKKNKKFEIKN